MADDRDEDTDLVQPSYTQVQEAPPPRFGTINQPQMRAALRGARKRRLQRLTGETFPPK